MTLPTGETFLTGVIEMKSWWQIDGSAPAQIDEALIGKKLAADKNFHVGDTIKFDGSDFKVSGIVSGGG